MFGLLYFYPELKDYANYDTPCVMCDALRKEYAFYNYSIEELRGNNESLKTENDSLKLEIHSLRTEIGRVRDETAKKEYVFYEDLIEELRGNIKLLRTTHEERVQQLLREIEGLNGINGPKNSTQRGAPRLTRKDKADNALLDKAIEQAQSERVKMLEGELAKKNLELAKAEDKFLGLITGEYAIADGLVLQSAVYKALEATNIDNSKCIDLYKDQLTHLLKDELVNGQETQKFRCKMEEKDLEHVKRENERLEAENEARQVFNLHFAKNAANFIKEGKKAISNKKDEAFLRELIAKHIELFRQAMGTA